MSKTYFDDVYATARPDATRDICHAWTATQEAEMGANGYVVPGRITTALAGTVPDKTIPVMDFGCGTGRSHLAVRFAGFEVFDGAGAASVETPDGLTALLPKSSLFALPFNDNAPKTSLPRAA